MFIQKSLLAGLLAATAAAHTSFRGCGALEPTEQQISDARNLDFEEQEKIAAGEVVAREAIEVDTVFHVVAAGKSFSDGYIPDKMLKDQLAVMNDNYAPYDISFNLINTTRTINPRWATNKDETAKKTALRQGDYKTLNLYFMKELEQGALGLCYFPEANAAPGSNVFIRDGCNILFDTVPGTNNTGFNEGKTVTHEVGHWFNLFHTFQGGCDGAGDHIKDTPAQQSPTSGCPKTRDSCPGGGPDPIHNYMDYSYDSCYEEFTDGQAMRAHKSFEKYRA